MDVKYIDVVRAQLLERRLDRVVHRLGVVADEAALDGDVRTTLVVRGVLSMSRQILVMTASPEAISPW